MENKEYPTYVFEERMESIKKILEITVMTH